MARKYVDCREVPSESNCSLYLSAEEDHLLEAATQHAINVHGHEDNQELRDMIQGAMKDERVEVGVASG